jgi:tetratricopeptide (TPR) repeat protein
MTQEKKDRYYFPIYELLAICEGMIRGGQRDDSNRFYEALLNTLPDQYRIKLGYAIVFTMNGSVDKGLAMLKEALSDHPSELRWEVLFRADDLIRSSRFDEASRALQFNVEEFPEWPLAYIRLAEFYEERGDKDKALENGRKALVLDPDNSDATAMLERLERPDP